MELRPAQLPAKVNELKKAMNDALQMEWVDSRGITVEKIALNPITLTDEDMKTMSERVSVAVDMIKSFCLAGMAITMNQFNKK